MKIGAAAWIAAVSPESSLVSAKLSDNGSALLSAPRDDEGADAVTQGREAAAKRDEWEQHEDADDEPCRGRRQGSSWSTPSLMKRNEAPQTPDRTSRRIASRRLTFPTLTAVSLQL